ncbi:MAG: 5'-nucleotidase C-terminal domain-containing protein [Gemmatimonadota bacterium]
MQRFRVAALTLALAACVPGRGSVEAGREPAGAPAESFDLIVAATTDVHGRLRGWDYYANSADTVRGLARAATVVDSLRALAPGRVVLVDAGDLLQGNPLTYYHGVVAPGETHPVIGAMNRLGYDAAALGNHEFNYGLDVLGRALEVAAFPFLAGNVFVAGTDSLAFPAWTLVERGGVRVAVLGFTTPGSAIWDRRHLGGRLEFRDIVASARQAWPEAAAASDVQIVIMHSGMGPGSSYDEVGTGVPPEEVGAALAEALPGLELVLLGHSHREIPSETVNGVLFAQAGRWAQALAVARIALEREENGWRLVDRDATVLSTQGVTADSSFLTELRPYHQPVLDYVADTIAWTPEPWSAADARLVDTPIIDLVQRVQLDVTGADLSTAAAFTTETRLGPGPITRADAAALYVYENMLQAIRITGRQLREYLEYSAKYFHRVTPEGEIADGSGDVDLFVDSVPGYDYDMIEGVEYAIDLTRPVGQRIVELTYRGAPVRDDQTFTLAINSYRANGGGGFAMIRDAPVVYDRNQEIRGLMIRWLDERDTVRQADVFRPSWRLLPDATVMRALADTAPWGPTPVVLGADSTPGRVVADDTTRLREIAEREARRIAGDARAIVDTTAARAAEPPAARGARARFLLDLPPARVDEDTVRIAFLATNDFHGALLPLSPSWARGDTVGGAATLAAHVKAVEARYPGATVWLDGGDVMQGTLISNLTHGRSTVEALNALGLDAAAVGNHEFDWTVDTLRVRIADADFAWLSANIFEKATGERPGWATPFVWSERAGLRIAIIGASTVSTPQTTMPQNVAAYEFRDIAEVVNELAPMLREEGADLIVLAAHAGAAADSAGVYRGEIVDAARRITVPVDLIVSGHTHTHVETVENGIPIVQARSSGTALGIVVLTYDRKANEVVDHAMDVITMYAWNVTPDSSVAAIVARHREAVHDIAERPIATLAQPLSRAARGEEWVLGDFIADAMRDAAGTQIAIMNPGGIRRELAAGAVTFDDVFAVQPFQNVLIRMELTGTLLERLLEAAVKDQLGQVSGIRFSFDPTRPAGDRVRDATLEDSGEEVLRDGDPLDPDGIYTVTVNNFMAAGGDEYAALQEVSSATNTGLVDSEVLAQYLTEQPQPIRYEPPRRITRLAPWPVIEE